jgi:hypothetical protein
VSHRWRVGRKLGRTLYRDDVCVGMVDSPEIAAEIVAAMNGMPPPERVHLVDKGRVLCLKKPDPGGLLWVARSLRGEATCPECLAEDERRRREP